MLFRYKLRMVNSSIRWRESIIGGTEGCLSYLSRNQRLLNCRRVPLPRYSSSSSTRWKTRQGKDVYTRDAKVQGLKSRAAFKLLEMDAKYKLFKKGQTVVDLGYAPGSWSQVAVERTKPTGRILGIDVIPAQPPPGVSTIQGNFLSRAVQDSVKLFLVDPDRGRPREATFQSLVDRERVEVMSKMYEQENSIDMDRQTDNHNITYKDTVLGFTENASVPLSEVGAKTGKIEHEKTVDIVLSDMSAPWDQTAGFWKKSLSGPYIRMMNTSGINFRDHAGSMDLCAAALQFARDTLKVGGHFVCKFYQGAEDKQLEAQLRRAFSIVHREKPESSRSESKEAYFIALRRRKETKDKVDNGP